MYEFKRPLKYRKGLVHQYDDNIFIWYDESGLIGNACYSLYQALLEQDAYTMTHLEARAEQSVWEQLGVLESEPDIALRSELLIACQAIMKAYGGPRYTLREYFTDQFIQDVTESRFSRLHAAALCELLEFLTRWKRWAEEAPQ